MKPGNQYVSFAYMVLNPAAMLRDKLKNLLFYSLRCCLRRVFLFYIIFGKGELTHENQ
jgi:hypothetical protein